MARIEVTSNDLDLIQSEMDEVNGKVEQLQELLRTGFVDEKQLELYLNGYAKIEKLLNNTYDSVLSNSSNVIKYNDELRNIEDVFISKFEDIEVPKIDVTTWVKQHENTIYNNEYGGTPEPEINSTPAPTVVDSDPTYVETTEVPLEDITGGSNNETNEEGQDALPPAPDQSEETELLDDLINETKANDEPVSEEPILDSTSTDLGIDSNDNNNMGASIGDSLSSLGIESDSVRANTPEGSLITDLTSEIANTLDGMESGN